jgi:hypothetical protein
MAPAQQPAYHVAAHAAEPDHAQLHLTSPHIILLS